MKMAFPIREWELVVMASVCIAQEAGEGRMAHNNDWNEVNVMVSNTQGNHSISAIAMSPSSPITVPPAACGI